jgi:hypothetical protein
LLVVALAAAGAGIGASAAAQQPPQPIISVKPDCTPSRPLRVSLTVSGTGFLIDDDVEVTFDVGEGRANQPFGTAVTTQNGTFQITRLFTARLDPPAGGYVIEAFARRGENGDTTVLRVPCTPPPTTTTTTRPTPSTTTTTTTPPRPVFTPTLTLSPGIGPPGFVATAVGAGWPPGPVTLGWDVGGAPISAVAGTDGRFAVPVLVQPGTTIGTHAMSGAGGSGSGATGGFLVVPRSMAPPLWVR